MYTIKKKLNLKLAKLVIQKRPLIKYNQNAN
uniref:Uncharacterized protein n=1 Tax=viral metagenome TaxID=1070528 RepID=A0A6C0H6U2_9ZZZZ